MAIRAAVTIKWKGKIGKSIEKRVRKRCQKSPTIMPPIKKTKNMSACSADRCNFKESEKISWNLYLIGGDVSSDRVICKQF